MYIVLSSIILGIFIICGITILGRYIMEISKNDEIGTYQMIKADEKNIIILDTRTGQYWKKPIVENSSIKNVNKEAERHT